MPSQDGFSLTLPAVTCPLANTYRIYRIRRQVLSVSGWQLSRLAGWLAGWLDSNLYKPHRRYYCYRSVTHTHSPSGHFSFLIYLELFSFYHFIAWMWCKPFWFAYFAIIILLSWSFCCRQEWRIIKLSRNCLLSAPDIRLCRNLAGY